MCVQWPAVTTVALTAFQVHSTFRILVLFKTLSQTWFATFCFKPGRRSGCINGNWALLVYWLIQWPRVNVLSDSCRPHDVKSESTAQTYRSSERRTERVATETVDDASFAYARITDEHYLEHMLSRSWLLHSKSQTPSVSLRLPTARRPPPSEDTSCLNY